MIKIEWEILDGWSVKGPDRKKNYLIIYMPYGLEECIVMPGEDILIPTGLYFSGLFTDYLIIPIHHTYPNEESDVLKMWNGKFSPNPTLHMSIVEDGLQVFIHIINLGNKEQKIKPGTRIAYFLFSPLININNVEDD